MDIPSSGAIFTLGKSHLAENTQSYFYIKNDPVKRLISGPHQSAVICESGRLFVWGENHYGQLGIGGGGGGTHKTNNSNNNNHSGDIVTKPTCVKALKTLGLKISDATFGNNWSVMLTHSNEIFFTGRNIFPEDTHVAQHFSRVQLENETCWIIRKPFRLEEFDDYLSKSEETENFVGVYAGNEHFAVLTSTGRLIGCGSNANQQLGELEDDYDGHPVEIRLDAKIQQFTCGPESTLVLTESGNLFLTGRLNEFVFPKFTELQKNLSSPEQIIFMHISKTSEIYIVTNVGSIYRSFESVRNKSLVFQRFYDYDGEENGPIWKLLKGFSFYAVLTKANKFFTTFSESGHHLKTFREISKFKNLRLLDIAVGDQHILVQGIPRSSTMSAGIGSAGEHRYMSRSFVLQPPELNGNEIRNSSARSLSKQLATENVEEMVEKMAETEVNAVESPVKLTEQSDRTNDSEIRKESEADINGNEEFVAENSSAQQPKEKTVEAPPSVIEKSMETVVSVAETHLEKPMKTDSKSSISSDSTETLQEDENKLRPRTPFPESRGSSPSQALKKTPMRNFSYEAAMEHDHLDRTSPELLDSLETVQENVTAEHSQSMVEAIVTTPTPPTEEDEKLAVEITTIKDALDSSKVINEIRFINNGIDVTSKVEEEMPDTPLEDSLDELESESEQVLNEVDEHINKVVYEGTTKLENASENIGDKIEAKLIETRDSMQTAMRKATTGAREAVDAMGDNAKRMATDARDAVEENAKRMAAGARDAAESVGENAKRMATDARDAVEENAKRMAAGARDAADAVGDNAKRIAAGALGAVDAAGENAKRVAAGARDAVGAAGENAKRMANDAVHAVENAGDSAVKAAVEKKDAMGKAVGSMTNKISHEINGAKENLSSLFQAKAAKDGNGQAPPSTPQGVDDEDIETFMKDSVSKTTTTMGSGEEDERTTASVNSIHTSNGGGNGNPFEPIGDESTNPFEDPLDAVVERGKKAMQEELRALELRAQSQTHVADKNGDEQGQNKGIMRQFLDNMRLSCRNEKSITTEDDKPNRITSHHTNKVNSELSLQNGHGDHHSSRVCTIL